MPSKLLRLLVSIPFCKVGTHLKYPENSTNMWNHQPITVLNFPKTCAPLKTNIFWNPKSCRSQDKKKTWLFCMLSAICFHQQIPIRQYSNDRIFKQKNWSKHLRCPWYPPLATFSAGRSSRCARGACIRYPMVQSEDFPWKSYWKVLMSIR